MRGRPVLHARARFGPALVSALRRAAAGLTGGTGRRSVAGSVALGSVQEENRFTTTDDAAQSAAATAGCATFWPQGGAGPTLTAEDKDEVPPRALRSPHARCTLAGSRRRSTRASATASTRSPRP
jgi:hypothetical protein